MKAKAKVKARRILAAYLVVLTIVICGIPVYAVTNYHVASSADKKGKDASADKNAKDTEDREDQPQAADDNNVETDTISRRITEGIAAVVEGDRLVHEEFSVSDLALDYLSTGSSIVVMTDSGIKRYNGSGANVAHCQVHIYLQCQDDPTTGVSYSMSCSVTDPVLDNGPYLPFANSDITIETAVHLDSLLHPKMRDPVAGLDLDLGTYNALLRLLSYYSGTGSHDDYLDNPLEGTDLNHTYTITGPHFTLL